MCVLWSLNGLHSEAAGPLPCSLVKLGPVGYEGEAGSNINLQSIPYGIPYKMNTGSNNRNYSNRKGAQIETNTKNARSVTHLSPV